MNTIETLPRVIYYKDDTYFLELHITLWDKYCLCYKGIKRDEFGNRNTILSTVVEGPGKRNYGDNVEGISDAVDLDDAVEIIRARINTHFKTVEKVVEK